MKTTQEELKIALQGIVKDIVNPILEEQKTESQKTLADLDAKIEAQVKRMMESKTHLDITGGTDRLEFDPKGGFKGLWHFCRDVARSDKRNGHTSKELENYDKIVIAKAAGTGMSEGDGEFGGHLIPIEFRRQFLQTSESEDELMPRCTRIPMTTNQIEIPYVNGFDQSGGLVFGGIEWKYTDEESQYNETRPKVGKVGMKLKKLIGLAFVTEEILSDSPISMEGLLSQGFATGLRFQYHKGIVRGTGAGTPRGFLNSPCLISVTKETGQAAATIVFENVVKMYSRVYRPSDCIWLANPDTLPQLVTMNLSVGTGGVPVWMPAGGISGKPFQTLFGLPLFFNDQCSTLGTAGDLNLVNLSQFLVGRKAEESDNADVNFTTSVHLKFDYDQVAFKARIRWDGSPWWPTTFTPPVSSVTRSPFVTIATRA